MKKLLLGVLLLWGSSALAAVPVSVTLLDAARQPVPISFVRFDLYNCGANIPVVQSSAGAIVQKTVDLRPDRSTGAVTGSIFGNDEILCGGVESTLWHVTAFSSSNQPIAGDQNYLIETTGGAWALSQANPFTGLRPPPGFQSIFANPIGNQTIRQPSGTSLFVVGTFDLTNATVVGCAVCGGSGGGGGGGSTVLVNGNTLPTGVTTANFGSLPLAPSGSFNIVWAKDALNPTNISGSVPYADPNTRGLMQLGADIGGTASAPFVVATHLASPLPVSQGGTSGSTAAGGFAALAPSPGGIGALLYSANGTSWSPLTRGADGTVLGALGGTLAFVSPGNVNGTDITPKSINNIQKADQFAGADACAKIVAAAAALPAAGGVVDAQGFQGGQACGSTVTVGSSSKQVKVLLGNATFSGSANPLFIVDRASSLVLSPGTIIQQTSGSATAVILAGTGPQWISGGIFGEGKILGPGSGTASVGVILGGSSDTGNSNGNSAQQTRIEGVQIGGFGTGIKIGALVSNWTLYHAMLGGSTAGDANGVGISFPAGLSASGENLSIIASNISGNVNQGLNAAGIGEFFISESSFDNDGNGTINPAITSTGVGSAISCRGCHFDQTTAGPDTRNLIVVTNGNLNLSGGTFTRTSNLTGSMILASGSTAFNIQGTVFAAPSVTVDAALTVANTANGVFAPGSVAAGYTSALSNGGTGRVASTLAGNLISPSLAASATGNHYAISVSNPAADRTLTIPDPLGSDTFVFQAAAQTLSNKTLASPIVSGTLDATNAAHTLPIIVKTTALISALSCSPGELAFATDATAGQNLYECPVNTFVQQLNTGVAGANQQLSNLSGTVAIPVSVSPSTAGNLALGTTSLPWSTLLFGSGAGATGQFAGPPFTGNRTFTFPDANATLTGLNVAQTWTATQTFAATLGNSFSGRAANTATGGLINGANGQVFRERNGGNTADVDVLALDSNNYVVLGGSSGSAGIKVTSSITTAAPGGVLTVQPQASTGNSAGANLTLAGGNAAGTGANSDVVLVPSTTGTGTQGLIISSGAHAWPLTNSPAGTQIYKLVSYDSSGRGVVTPAGSTQGLAGVCAESCTTSGTAQIVKMGTIGLNFDNTPSPQDYACISSTTAGFAHGCGQSPTTETVGVVRSAVSGTIYNVDVLLGSVSTGVANAVVTNPGANQTIQATSPTAISLRVDAPTGAAGSQAVFQVRDATGSPAFQVNADKSTQLGTGTGGSVILTHVLSPTTPSATTSLIECGDTDDCLGFRNHANTDDINLSKNAQDVVTLLQKLTPSTPVNFKTGNFLGIGNTLDLTEDVAPSNSALHDTLYASSVFDKWMMKANGGAERAVSPTSILRVVSGTSDTITAVDDNAIVQYTSASGKAVALPTATGAFANNFCFTGWSTGGGTATLTPVSGTVNGSASLAISSGASARLCSDGTGNWLGIASISSAGAGDMLLNSPNPMGGSGTLDASAMAANALLVPQGAGTSCSTKGAICFDTTSNLLGFGNGTGTIRPGQMLPRNVTITSDTIVTSDRGKLVTYSNGSAIAVTLPQASATFPAGWYFFPANRGAGAVTITPTTSTIDGGASVTLTQNQSICVTSNGTDYFTGCRGISTGLQDPGTGTGFLAHTGLNATVQRTLTGTTNHITITNPTGAAGDPVFDIGTAVVTQTTDGTTGNLPVYAGNNRVLTPSTVALTALAHVDTGNTFIGHQTIEGVLSTGATGTGKFVFDASPTITGHATIEGVTTTGATGSGKFVFDSGPTLSGHPTIEGVTSTGATGTGKLVFDTAPTFTTSATAPIFVSTVATGTAPFTVASTTNVANLNASSLAGATFAAPGAIGGGTPASGAFTTISASGQVTSTVSTGTAPLVIASTTNVANLNASSLSGATFAAPGAIGGGTPGTAAFTTVTGTSSITLGVNGGTGGSLVLNGSTSGSATINVAATGGLQLGTPTSLTLTNATGLPVAGGGTGLSTLTAHALYAGNATSAPIAIGPDASTTKALFSAGSSADPAFRVIAAADLPAVATVFNSGTISVPAGNAVLVGCTSTCSVPVPVPAAGYQICVKNDAGISTVITLSALGSSAMYPKADDSGYGTAGTGTMVSTAAAGNKVCLIGRDSTHYELGSVNAAANWTVN